MFNMSDGQVLTGREQLQRQPLRKPTKPDQIRTFQQYQVQHHPAQISVGAVGRQLSDEDRKLLDKYEVTSDFLLDEFKRGCAESRKRNSSGESKVVHGLIVGSVYMSSGLLPAIGVEAAINVGTPLLSGGVRYVKSRYKGEVAVCDRVIQLQKAELEGFEESSDKQHKALKRCRDDLEDWFRDEDWFEGDFDEKSLKKMKVENQQNWDEDIEKVSEYEDKIQVACFEASANGECTEETPDGSAETQTQIKVYEATQEYHKEGCRNAEEVDNFIRAYPYLAGEMNHLLEQEEICHTQLRELTSDREKLLLIKQRM
ncbi:hypothetical protein M3P05_01120 [Sansalvadorimonas sp. 2012CJ34-2]|uniref:Uncharacterized protein n=1 Tax=Parendozoicomonas callyspongiae TaxID=2942213 RepID=A0ABT0PB89_9GAMM|nr:hypothetical protein [Sansalvadorimonas sp. 2012CJ34-2]MCL6268553.1 hypothetical protein [Sansalvadorimonas sp. 2012CJ34-2]